MRQLNFNHLSAKISKWLNTLKQFVDNLPTNCLSVFDYFVELALKGLRNLLNSTFSEKYFTAARSDSETRIWMFLHNVDTQEPF